jgi:hypothetical protein
MPKKPGPEALAFIVAALKANKGVSYADVKERADKKGLRIYPVMYGRAKALLGLVKVSPRGQGRFALAKRGLLPARRPGRPARGSGGGSVGSSIDGLQGMLASIRNSEQERQRLRGTLERVRTMVSEALGG